ARGREHNQYDQRSPRECPLATPRRPDLSRLARHTAQVNDEFAHRLISVRGIFLQSLLHRGLKTGGHAPVQLPKQRRGGGVGGWTMACNNSRPAGPTKGRLPASTSKSTMPNEKMSLRASSGFPDACSGDM